LFLVDFLLSILELYKESEKMRKIIPILLLGLIISTVIAAVEISERPIYEERQVKNYVVGYYPNGTRWERVDIFNVSVQVDTETWVEINPLPVVVMLVTLYMVYYGGKSR